VIAAACVPVTTSQSGLDGSLRSIGFVSPAVSHATGPGVVSATPGRPLRSSHSRSIASFVSVSGFTLT